MMNSSQRDDVFFVGDDSDFFQPEPIAGKTQIAIWSALLAAFGCLLLVMRNWMSSPWFLATLLIMLVCMVIVAMALSLKATGPAVVTIVAIHFLALLSNLAFPIIIVVSFFAQLAAVILCRSFFHGSLTRIWPISFLAVVIALFGGMMIHRTAARPIYEARSQYPFESLESRLAYENKTIRHRETSVSVGTALGRLDDMDNGWRSGSDRVAKLRQIHSSYVERFAGTPGFGVSRMPRSEPLPIPEVDLKTLTLDDASGGQVWPDMMDESVLAYRRSNEELVNPWIYYPLALTEQVDGFDYHFAATKDFLNPATFGYVNEQREVAGFVEHAFHHSPPSLKHDQVVWSLDRLQLVSLLQFDKPQVYRTESLPRMDEISSLTVPIRELDAFEEAALAELWNSEETIMKIDDGQLRMMGALRARNQCMECHNVNHGELLGAFTYTFVDGNLPRIADDTQLTSK